MSQIVTIRTPRDEKVFIHFMKGHFITASTHINYYVGTSDIKHNHDVSVDAAKLMVSHYSEIGTEVDTVLCLYETQALGAYLAHELSKPTMFFQNPHSVFVLGPEYDASGNMIFRDNLKRMINGKRVVILISCITSGKTAERAVESVRYYGGSVVGISAAFSAMDHVDDVAVNSIFTAEDLPGYQTYSACDCPMCKAGAPVNALANGYGYSKL